MRCPRAPHFAMRRWCGGAAVGVSVCAIAACAPTSPKALVVELPEGSSALAQVTGATQSREAEFSLRRRCEITYDAFTLPLVAPDGARAAIQSGSAATWPVILAESEEVPLASVSVVSLTEAPTPIVTRVEGEALLLGRSADATGFLVEAPQQTGSRWIGLVSWMGGAPAWLVRDDAVNAFATQSPTGLLAWCRRAQGETGFAIAIGRAPTLGGSPVCLAPAPRGGSWLFPEFSVDGRTLFALKLRDGVLTACAFPIVDERIADPSATYDISWRADAKMAFQTVTTVNCWAPRETRFAFYHPKFERIAVWNPGDGAIALASPGTIALVELDGSRVLATTPHAIGLEATPTTAKATESASVLRLLDAPWIPLNPANDGSILIGHAREGRMEIAELRLSRSGR